MARGAYVSEGKFNAIKILQRSGVRIVDAVRTSGLSRSSVARIYKYRTFDEFANRGAVKAPKEPTVREEPKRDTADRTANAVTISANRYVMEELRKQTDLLTTISKKMMYMMELMEKGVQTDID